MTEQGIDACIPVDISDDDVYSAMSEIPGYIDITPADFKDIYVKAYQHALHRLIRSVKVAEVMTSNVVTVIRTTPIVEVAELMAQHRVSGVPVLEAHGTVAGVISERDFLMAMGVGKTGRFMEVVAACLRGCSCLTMPLEARLAEDIMSSPPITVTADTPLMEVADILTSRRVNRVPVVDEEGRLVGIVSRADVVRSSFVG